MRTLLFVLVDLLLILAVASQLVRWWRVLQREHYIASSLLATWGRWLLPPSSVVRGATLRRADRVRRAVPVGALLLITAAVVTLFDSLVGVLIAAITLLVYPWGLSIRGRTSRLAFTRRMTTVAMVSATLTLVALAAAVIASYATLAVIVAAVVPVWIALATLVLAPVEERSAQRFVDAAATRLRRVNPRVIAITGSFGKTSTKNHLATVLGGSVASSLRHEVSITVRDCHVP